MEPWSRDDFEFWLFKMDDELDELLDSLPAIVADRLDYSLESLSVLEGWLLDQYASTAALTSAESGRVADRLARYVGEAIRKNLGGQWDIDLTNRRNVFFSIPVVRQSGAWEAAPLSLITASVDRATGDYLERVARAYVARNSPKRES